MKSEIFFRLEIEYSKKKIRYIEITSGKNRHGGGKMLTLLDCWTLTSVDGAEFDLTELGKWTSRSPCFLARLLLRHEISICINNMLV